MTNSWFLHRVLFVVLSAVLPAAPVVAQQIQPLQADQAGFLYSLRAGANVSDNINRLPASLEQSAAAAVAGLELQAARPTGRLRYAAAADLTRYQFIDFSQDGQTFGRAALTSELDLLADRILLNSSVAYEQQREDIFRPIAVGNLADRVTTSVGPTVRLPFGNTAEAQLDARYSRIDFSGFFEDSETVGGRAQLLRRRSALSTFGVGVSYEDTTYARAPQFDFRRTEAFVRLDSTLARTEIDAELGYATARGNTFDQSGAMLRTRFTRRLTPTLRAYVSYLRQYPTAQGGVPLLGVDQPAGGAVDVSILTAAPRLAVVSEVGLTYRRTRTTAEIAYASREEEALIAGIGRRNFDEYRISLQRQMTPRSRFSIFGTMTSETFLAQSLSAKEYGIGGQLGFDVGRSIGVDFRVEHRSRDDNFALSFSEANAGVYFRYFGGLVRGR